MAITTPSQIAEWFPLPGKSTTPIQPRIIDVHTMVWNMLDCQDYFATKGNPYSHFGTGWDGNKWCARQWQDLTFRAASDLDGNPFCISIENADKGHGFPTWSGSDVPRFVPEQAEVLAQLIAWLCVRFDIPPYLVANSRTDQHGPGYHRHGIDPYRVPDGVRYSSSYGKACPGDRRIAQMTDEIMPRVRAIINPPPLPISLEESMEFVMWHPGNNTFWYCSTTGHFAVEVTSDAHGKLAGNDKVESFSFTATDTDAILAAVRGPQLPPA